MTLRNVIRAAVAIGWLVIALFLERILTLGAMTDLSGVGQNGPVLVAVAAASIVVALGIAVAVVLGHRVWPVASFGASVPYAVVGVWLRTSNGDDSGAAIVLTAGLVAVLSLLTIQDRRRVAATSGGEPGR